MKKVINLIRDSFKALILDIKIVSSIVLVELLVFIVVYVVNRLVFKSVETSYEIIFLYFIGFVCLVNGIIVPFYLLIKALVRGIKKNKYFFVTEFVFVEVVTFLAHVMTIIYIYIIEPGILLGYSDTQEMTGFLYAPFLLLFSFIIILVISIFNQIILASVLLYRKRKIR